MHDLFDSELFGHGFDGVAPLFLIVLARTIPIVELAPFLGGRFTPRVVKMAVAFALALLVAPYVLTPSNILSTPRTIELAFLLAKEALVGLTIGFVSALVFEAIRMGGQTIDAVRGETMANVMVGRHPERASPTSTYLHQLAIALFFAIGGHLVFIAAMVRSYRDIPPLSYPAFSDGGFALVETIGRLTVDAITVGVLFALPVITALLLAELTLALINRAAPQMNVFFLGMPLRALLGTAVVLLGLGIFADELFVHASTYLAGARSVIVDIVAPAGAP